VSEGITFKRLKLTRWRQFAAVDVEFHPTLTVLTGANGSGKSTLLNILARQVGQERPYLSTPVRDERGVIQYVSGRLKGLWDWLPIMRSMATWSNKRQMGELDYSEGASAAILLPDSVGHQYALEFSHQPGIAGLVISSHRLVSTYSRLDNLPFEGISPETAFSYFMNAANQRYMGEFSGRSMMFFIKQALAAWAAIGEGNSVFQSDPLQKAAYDGFIEMLRKILPTTLGFITLSVRPPDVVLVTRSGEFLIDAASGGVTSLIEVGALIYAMSIRPQLKDKRFVVVYDEPENHLHPQLQRSLFRNLTNAFPRAQFIVATHSPFIVSSLKESNVYVLRYETSERRLGNDSERSRVVSEKLDYTNRAGTASEILRDVLGLPTTLPEWVEGDLVSIVERFQTRVVNENLISELKAALKEAGLSELFPEALVRMSRDR
jgi:energy-coupling factor transporter ATP-binding protein EcfA2